MTVTVVTRTRDAKNLEAGTLLNSLSDVEFKALRNIQSPKDERLAPNFRCGMCSAPVFSRLSLKGTRHFAHRRHTGAGCPWHEEHVRSISEIDSGRFANKRESQKHRSLKSIVEFMLAFDTAFDKPMQERTLCIDQERKRPDVHAESFLGQSIAFDIQLSSTYAPVIYSRNQFYKKNSVRYVWLVGGSVDELNRQAFKDIYFENDGQIFGVSEECRTRCVQRGEAHFWIHSIRPRLNTDGLTIRWSSKMHARSEIDWDQPSSGFPKSETLLSFDDSMINLVESSDLKAIRRSVLNAVKRGNEEAAHEGWDKIVNRVGGSSWSTLQAISGNGFLKILGAFQTGIQNQKAVACRYGENDVVGIINSLLLEPENRRRFASSFKQTMQKANPQLLAVESIKNKLDRNLDQQDSPEFHRYEMAFHILFPRGAWNRLRFSSFETDDRV